MAGPLNRRILLANCDESEDQRSVRSKAVILGVSEAHAYIGGAHDTFPDDEGNQAVTIVSAQDQLVGVSMHAAYPTIEHSRRRALDPRIGMALRPSRINLVAVMQQIAKLGNLDDSESPYPRRML